MVPGVEAGGHSLGLDDIPLLVDLSIGGDFVDGEGAAPRSVTSRANLPGDIIVPAEHRACI